MLGVFLLNFYLTNPVGIVSIVIGTLGYFILHPAVDKWNTRIWGDDANEM